jgi:hypothetical protein
MWVRRTAEEMKAAVRAERLKRVGYGIVAGLLVATTVEFIFGGPDADRWHTHIVPNDQLLPRLPWAIFAGICVGYAIFKGMRSKREAWIALDARPQSSRTELWNVLVEADSKISKR